MCEKPHTHHKEELASSVFPMITQAKQIEVAPSSYTCVCAELALGASRSRRDWILTLVNHDLTKKISMNGTWERDYMYLRVCFYKKQSVIESLTGNNPPSIPVLAIVSNPLMGSLWSSLLQDIRNNTESIR